MMETERTRRSTRGWIVIALRWIAALSVLGVLLHFLPLDTVRSAITRVPPAHFLAALAGYLLAHALGMLKWRMVVNAAGAELDLATSLQCYGGGLFGTLFLPSIVGGDVIRLAVGLRKSPRPAAVLAGNVVDRFLDVAAQAGLVALGLILLPGSLPESLRAVAVRTLLVAFAIGALLFAIVFSLRGVLLRGRSFRFRRRLARLRHALRGVSARPHILVAGWLAGKVVQGGGFGLIVDIIVGIVGAVIGGYLAGVLGISVGGGWISSIIVAVIGAVLLLFVRPLIKRA